MLSQDFMFDGPEHVRIDQKNHEFYLSLTNS